MTDVLNYKNVPQVPSQAGKLTGPMKPPQWLEYQAYYETSGAQSAFTVPDNVYQIYACVWGGGATGVAATRSGGGGGFAGGIIDVVPGQVLPTITIGAISGTSSIGTWLTATGASAGAVTGGVGTASSIVRKALTYAGGTGGTGVSSCSGAASGSPYGTGGNGSNGTTALGGAGWGCNASGVRTGMGIKPALTNTHGGGTFVDSNGIGGGRGQYVAQITAVGPAVGGGTGGGDGTFLDIANKTLSGGGGGSTTMASTIAGSGGPGGGGGYASGTASDGGNGGIGGGGGGSLSGNGGYGGFGGGGAGGPTTTNPGIGGPGGGGGGSSDTGGVNGGIGAVILYWTTGY